MEITVTSKMNRKNMFDFLLRHTFFSFTGYIGLLVSVCAFAAAIYTWGKLDSMSCFLLIFTGCLFLVIEPIMLFYRAGILVKEGGEFHIPITYTLSDRGIQLARNGETAFYAWGDVSKVTTTKYSLVLYCGKLLAFILTKEAIGDQFDALEALIRRKATPKYMKISK